MICNKIHLLISWLLILSGADYTILIQAGWLHRQNVQEPRFLLLIVHLFQLMQDDAVFHLIVSLMIK